jgi:hypothetical protein
MSGNPVAGKLNIFTSTLFSYVYAPVGETDVVLKAHELWCDGKQIDVCLTATMRLWRGRRPSTKS